MTEQPIVSIITPSLNQGIYITATIESVLMQDYPRIEYLVVDGGSHDATLSILRRYDGRLQWLAGSDGGQADAINKGVAQTTGEIVAWLNSDDVYTRGAVSRAVKELQDCAEASLVYGNAELIDRTGAVIGPCQFIEPFDLRRLIHYTDFIVQPAAFFRREAFAAVGGLDPDLRYCFDYDLWIRLASRGPVRYVPDVLARARIHPETKTATGGLERMTEIERMIQRHGRRILPCQYYLEMFQECGHAGRQALVARQWATAVSCAWRGSFYGAALAIRELRQRLPGRSSPGIPRHPAR